MARPPACRSPHRNPPPIGKDEPTGPALPEGNDTHTSAPIVSRAPTLAPAPAPAPPLNLAPVDANAMVRYLEPEVQRILRAVLKARPLAPAPVLQPFVFANGPCDKPLKARFPELYCGKTHME